MLIFSVYKHIKRVPINDYSNIIVSLQGMPTIDGGGNGGGYGGGEGN